MPRFRWPERRVVTLVLLGALILLVPASFVTGNRLGQSTSAISGSISVANYDHTEGCVRLVSGKEICGAFVSKEGGDNGLFQLGTNVFGEIATIPLSGSERTVMLLVVAG